MRKLDKLFFEIEDKVEEHPNNTMSLTVVLTPRFGKFGLFVWFILNKIFYKE